jgi:hypothetical protein
LASSLGNAGVVVTADSKIVCLTRTEAVGEAQGMVCLPGGHAEPSRLAELTAETVAHELFDSVLREVDSDARVTL